MPAEKIEPLPKALLSMTAPFDWKWVQLSPDTPPQEKPAPNTVKITLVDFTNATIPMQLAYGWFHKDIDDSARGARLLNSVLDAHGDQDRLHYAEDYAGLVLATTDLEDAMWFRRGVMIKEAIPGTLYPRQRDHTIHTLHNYLLGWYFFINSSAVNKEFRKAFAVRGCRTTDDSTILRFGELWCFASLLHDVGYLFEGNIPNDTMELVDKGIRDGAAWASDYFHDMFWREWKLRGPDEKKTARTLAKFELEPTIEGGPGRIVDYLRDLGSLQHLTVALKTEMGDGFQVLSALSPDAFSIWAANYRAFGQPEMAERIEGLEEALYNLIDKGLPDSSVRILDHGICGGLTYWFRFFFAIQQAQPPSGSPEATLKKRIQSQLEGKHGYHAAHWWRSVVWATAAVALHNIQQTPTIPGWKKQLRLQDDPLAYLGVLVDILQEWDRHSMRRVLAVNSRQRMINSGDVAIGTMPDGRICIRYGCRDATAAERLPKLKKDLDDALLGWDELMDVSFHDI